MYSEKRGYIMVRRNLIRYPVILVHRENEHLTAMEGNNEPMLLEFLRLVLDVLLAIGGVESNPGPLNQVFRSESPFPGSNTFQKRDGMATIDGVQYERFMSALLFLRALNSKTDFYLGCNMEGVGAFDDNVLFHQQGNSTTAYFIQQKYRKNDKRGDNNFVSNLLKYYSSFRCVKEKYFKDPHLKVELIFCTNNILKHSSHLETDDHILNTGGDKFSYSVFDEDMRTFFSDLIKYEKLLRQIEGASRKTIVKMISVFIEQFKCQEFFYKLNFLKSRPKQETVSNFIAEIDGLVNLSTFQMFLKHLHIFHNQANNNELMELIKSEFHKACGTIDIEVDPIIKIFMDKMENWANEEGECKFLTAEDQLWKDVIKEVMDMLSEPKYKEMISLGVKFNTAEIQALKTETLMKQNVKIIAEPSTTVLSMLKMHQVLGTKPHLIMGAETVQKQLKAVIQACQNSEYNIVLVDGILQPEVEHILVRVAKKCVVIYPKQSQTKRPNIVTDICCLSQLDRASQDTLLNRNIIFQNHQVTLGVLVEKDCTLLKAISGSALMQLITNSNNISIGHKLESAIDYYVPRTLLQKRNVKDEILRCHHPSTLLAISGASKKLKNEILSGAEVYHCNHPVTKQSKCIIIKDIKDEEAFKSSIVRDERNIHLFRTNQNGLVWKWSNQDVTTIREYINQNIDSPHKPKLISDISDKLVLIVAEPGMGKTTLLNQLAWETKRADPSSCIVRINLREYTKFFNSVSLEKNEQIMDLLKLAVRVEIKNDSLEKVLFENIVEKNKNLIILLDGFDEISPDYTEIGIRLIQSFQNMNVNKLWVTCRIVTSELLQNKLCTLPFTLQPFKLDDRKNFLQRFWRRNELTKSELENFVCDVLNVVHNSLGFEETDLAGIPLQTVMIAEAFRNEYETYQQTKSLHLPKQINIVLLYDKFIERKYRIYFQRVNPNHTFTKTQMSRSVEQFNRKHSILALVSLLPERDLDSLNYNGQSIMKKFDKYVQDEGLCEEIASVGIINHLYKRKPQFVHRTFAEHFAAVWFTKNFETNRKNLKNKLFDPNFSVIRNMFDRMLARGCKLHNAVLNREEHSVKQLLNEQVDLKAKDAGGRYAIHLAAMYGLTNILRILISANLNVKVGDDVLKWSAIQYADRCEEWGAVEMLLQASSRAEELKHLSYIVYKSVNIDQVLTVSVDLGYVNVIKFILSKGIKVNKVIDHVGSTLLHRAAKCGQTETVSYLLRYESNVSNQTPFLRKSNSTVHVENYAGHTPLDLALAGGHQATANCLVKAGASINHSDRAGFTQMHWAARAGSDVKLKSLLNCHADVNVVNSCGESPLHVAVRSLLATEPSANDEKHFQIISSLLSSGASVNNKDSTGLTPLHWVAATNRLVFPVTLIQHGADINRKDGQGCTPLHWAAWRSNEEVVESLIQAGAKCNVANEFGCTPLHWAAWGGSLLVVNLLLRCGAILNAVNSYDCTPLCMAHNRKHIHVIDFLERIGGLTCGPNVCLNE